MNQNAMLDKAKELLSIATDTELAQALGVDQTTISKVRRGRNNLGPETALRLAEILGIDPAKVAAAAYAARATSSTAKRKWEKAAALCIVLAAAWASTPGTSIAAETVINIMRSLGRRTGERLTKEPKNEADTNETRTTGERRNEIQRKGNRIAVGKVARVTNQPGEHHDEQRENHRPVTTRSVAMESGILRPGAPQRLRFTVCPALRPRKVRAPRMFSSVRQGSRPAGAAGTSARRATAA